MTGPEVVLMAYLARFAVFRHDDGVVCLLRKARCSVLQHAAVGRLCMTLCWSTLTMYIVAYEA